MRTGFTTGTCAAAAASAAAQVLAGLPVPTEVELVLPADGPALLPIDSARINEDGTASATVRKFAGDDPDVTDGALISVRVTKVPDDRVTFRAGPGVGTITLAGLQLPPGEAAINPVPRQMITTAIRNVLEGGVDVEVSVAGGEELAQKTFNPRLGIVGGISIIGTTGIVRPYCRKAFLTALRCGIDVAASNGSNVVLVPGNIGAKAVNNAYAVAPSQVIEVGNEWAEALDHLKSLSFEHVLVAGHPGKLAKFLNGQWQTHSGHSDSATGAVLKLARQLGLAPSETPTVEGIFASLSRHDQQTLGNALAEAIASKVRNRADLKDSPACLLANMAGETIGLVGEAGL